MWVLWSIIFLLTLAFMIEVNRHFKASGISINFLRSVIAVLLLLPFIPLMKWPNLLANPWFYVVGIAEGLFSVYAMTITLNLAAKQQSRTAAMQGPLMTIIMFVVWAIISPASLVVLLQNPLQGAGVVLALVMAIGAIQIVRRNEHGWKLFLTILPIAGAFAIINLGFRLVTPAEDVFKAALALTFLQFVALVLGTSLFNLKRIKKWDFTRHEYIASFWYGLFSIGCFAASINAIILAPNPAYPSIIIMTLPVVLWAWHKVTKQSDGASPSAGFIMVVAAILLVLSTAF